MAMYTPSGIIPTDGSLADFGRGPWPTLQTYFDTISRAYRTPGAQFLVTIPGGYEEYRLVGGKDLVHAVLISTISNEQVSYWISPPADEKVDTLSLTPNDGDIVMHEGVIKQYDANGLVWIDLFGGSGTPLQTKMAIIVGKVFINDVLFSNQIFIYEEVSEGVFEWVRKTDTLAPNWDMFYTMYANNKRRVRDLTVAPDTINDVRVIQNSGLYYVNSNITNLPAAVITLDPIQKIFLTVNFHDEENMMYVLATKDDMYIQVKSENVYGEWMPWKGDPGIDGKNIELQKSLTHVQWKNVGDVDWIDIIALADLIGPSGKEVGLSVSTTHIIWKLGDGEWVNLIALSALKGADGQTPMMRKDPDTNWLQWKLPSDLSWTNLYNMDAYFISIDNALSLESSNPVENKVITEALQDYVTVATQQTITGQKTFKEDIILHKELVVSDYTANFGPINYKDTSTLLGERYYSFGYNSNTEQNLNMRAIFEGYLAKNNGRWTDVGYAITTSDYKASDVRNEIWYIQIDGVNRRFMPFLWQNNYIEGAFVDENNVAITGLIFPGLGFSFESVTQTIFINAAVKNVPIPVDDYDAVPKVYLTDELNTLLLPKKNITRNRVFITLPKNYSGSLDLTTGIYESVQDIIVIDQAAPIEEDDEIVIENIKFNNNYRDLNIHFRALNRIRIKANLDLYPDDKDLIFYGYNREFLLLTDENYYGYSKYKLGYTNGVTPPIKGGYLYNHQTIRDVRNVAPIGWRVPTLDDLNILTATVGDDPSIHLNRARLTNETHPLYPIAFLYSSFYNILDTYGFKGLAPGGRAHDTGVYSGARIYSYYWCQPNDPNNFGLWFGFRYNTLTVHTTYGHPNHGFSIRLIKEDSTDFIQDDLMECNSGLKYKTCKIGNQVWMAENLCTSHFRNGDVIPKVSDNGAWVAATTPARCLYNNDIKYK